MPRAGNGPVGDDLSRDWGTLPRLTKSGSGASWEASRDVSIAYTRDSTTRTKHFPKIVFQEPTDYELGLRRVA